MRDPKPQKMSSASQADDDEAAAEKDRRET